jgi:hypothetical protein
MGGAEVPGAEDGEARLGRSCGRVGHFFPLVGVVWVQL